MLGQSAIGILESKADQIRNYKVAVTGNASGTEGRAKVRRERF